MTDLYEKLATEPQTIQGEQRMDDRINPETGRQHAHNFKGGTTAQDGSVLVWVGKAHHLANVLGYARAQRIAAEQMLGRRLLPTESVRHKDGDKSNNEFSNLVIKQQQGFHGLPEYKVWNCMKQRCHNPANKQFNDYGGRGITVCDRWRDSFANFIRDMGYRPSPGLSIERIDNDRGYSKDNCRWATRVEQARNRRSSRLITFGDRTKTMIEWCRENGVAPCTFLMRLDRGWNERDAMFTPVKANPRKMTLEIANEIRRQKSAGKIQRDIATDFGVSESTVSMILQNKIWRSALATAGS